MFWIYFTFISICFSSSRTMTTPGPQEEMVDIATIDTNITDLLKKMPKTLSFTLNAMSAKEPIILNLKLKKTIKENSFVYVVRQDENGTMVVVKENIPVNKNIGLYQDKATGAAITVKCEGLQDGYCNPVMFGSIHINDTEYDLSEISAADISTSPTDVPISPTSLASPTESISPTNPTSPTQPGEPVAAREKRRASEDKKKKKRKEKKEKRRRKKEKKEKKMKKKKEKSRKKTDKSKRKNQRRIYKLMRRRHRNFFNKDDFIEFDKDAKDNLIKKETNIPVGKALPFFTELKTVDISNESTPQVLGRSMVSTSVKRNDVAPDDTYNVELLLVIDYSIYEREYNQVVGGTSRSRDIEAKRRIRRYFAHVVNGINLRYDNIDTNKFHINVAVSGYIIADRPEISVWTASASGGLVESKVALDSLRSWRLNVASLPEHDHMMLFTALDLYRFNPTRNKITGLASFKAMCSASSTSVVEDNGVYGSISTGTHELAHSLGVRHDGSGNGCSSNSKYIMATTGGITSEINELNPWRFSTCSIEQFHVFLTGLGPGNCLMDEALVYDMDEFNKVTSNEAGQHYDPNEQCKQRAGKNSFYGWGGGLGEYRDICTSMACKSDTSDTSYLIHTAVRGTSCGNKKWCIDGMCVYDDKAPVKDDNCVHGDSQRLFDGQSCSQMIMTEPSKCYEEYYKEFCCKSCKDIYQPIRGCEYGDKNSRNCKSVLNKPHLCYSLRNEDICCSTCHKLNTKYTGCEYGDRVHEVIGGTCYKWQCAGNPDYQKACCKTCGLIPNAPITTGKPIATPPQSITPTGIVPTRGPTQQPTQPPTPGTFTSTSGTPTKRPILIPTKPIPTRKPNLPPFPMPPKPSTGITTVPPISPSDLTPPVPSIVTGPPIMPTKPRPPKPINPRPPFIPSQQRPVEDYCVRKDGKFRSMTCTTVARWMTNICSNSVLRMICCLPCATAAPTCENKGSCLNVQGRHCYDGYVREECCQSCKKFETGEKDCMFGDSSSSCARLMSFWPDYVCDKHAKTCCGSCKPLRIKRPAITILSRKMENTITNTLERRQKSPFQQLTVPKKTILNVRRPKIVTINSVISRGDQMPEIKAGDTDHNDTKDETTWKRNRKDKGKGRGRKLQRDKKKGKKQHRRHWWKRNKW